MSLDRRSASQFVRFGGNRRKDGPGDVVPLVLPPDRAGMRVEDEGRPEVPLRQLRSRKTSDKLEEEAEDGKEGEEKLGSGGRHTGGDVGVKGSKRECEGVCGGKGM